MQALADLITWLEPHALLLALALPPVIRIVGHWIPEEIFMVAIGVLAARSISTREAALIFGAVTLSHFTTDQVVYLAGRWLRPRLDRFPRIATRLGAVTRRLTNSPGALIGLVPARVLPLGRGAWLAAANRAQRALEKYDGSTATIPALELLVRAYDKLGLEQEKADAQQVLERTRGTDADT